MAAKPESDGVRKFLDSLPESVRGNVESLRGVQAECDVVRARYLKEKKALEEKYRVEYEPLFKKRMSLVVGGDSVPAEANGEEPGAVPGFWLRVLKNPDMVGDHVTKRDEPILKYLMDIRSDNLEEGAAGFKLVFQFAPNPYFTPLTLDKKYYMGSDDESVLEKTEGTEIAWAEGKNPSFKVVKKKSSKPGEAPGTKVIEKHSFFDFFSPPELPGGDGDQPDEMTDIAELLAEDDFELGCYIKEVLIPSAVSWFTGELADERDSDMEDDDEDDDDDSSDDESDSDSD